MTLILDMTTIIMVTEPFIIGDIKRKRNHK